MKKTLVTTVCALATVAAFGQGQIYFSSTIGGAQDNTITLPDGKTAADSPYQAELAVGNTPSTLTLIPSSITPVTAGYILGPTLTLSGVTAGNAVDYQVYVWNPANGSSYAAAAAKAGDIIGSTAVITGYTTGGAGSPPSTPAALTFAPFSLTVVPSVPEPSTIALGAIGIGALLIRRRK